MFYGQQSPAFSTPEGREDFMHFYKGDPHGAAMSHARFTRLGIWGSERDLMMDCAKIMSIELAAVHQEQERHAKFDPDLFPAKAIMKLRSFHASFYEARKEDEGKMNNSVRRLLLYRGNSSAPPHQDTHVDEYILDRAHEVIYKEFSKVYLR